VARLVRTTVATDDLHDADLDVVAARPHEAGVAGHQRALECFGQGHVDGVIGAEVVAQGERTSA
jgi:hypothetical protein